MTSFGFNQASKLFYLKETATEQVMFKNLLQGHTVLCIPPPPNPPNPTDVRPRTSCPLESHTHAPCTMHHPHAMAKTNTPKTPRDQEEEGTCTWVLPPGTLFSSPPPDRGY